MPKESALAFWDSEGAEDYPSKVTIGETTLLLYDGVGARTAIGELIRRQNWIPSTGEIIDLGAGPSSAWVFGEGVIGRVTAVDFSKQQLGRNPIPWERKRIMDLMDLRNSDFPSDWQNRFDLATSIFLSRYLLTDYRKALYSSVQRILTVSGRLVVVDTSSLYERKMAELMGEVERFDERIEAKILERCGFEQVQFGQWIVYFAISSGVASIYYATGIKKES